MVGFILSCASPSLQSPSSQPRPGAHVRAPSLGFLPSSRPQPAESTYASVPGSLGSVLDVSHVLDGLLLCRPRGLVSSRCHVQGSLFRVFPSREAARARRPPLPSCRWRVAPAGCPAPGLRASPPRPCSSRESVAARGVLGRRLPATLLSFVLPRVLLRARCRRPSPPAPTPAFHGPRRLSRTRPGALSRARLPRSRFPACCSAATCVEASLRGRVHQAIRFDRRTSGSFCETRTNSGAAATARKHAGAPARECPRIAQGCGLPEGSL